MPTLNSGLPPESSLVVRLDKFDKTVGLDRGRPFWYEAAWYLVKCVFFLSPVPWPTKLKRWLLVRFGARVGTGLVLRPRVNFHMPWKLVIGDHCWIGEGCEFLNLEPIVLSDHVVVSHRVYLAAGNHDWEDHTMPYRNAPITIERGAWVASCAFVGPGVTVGEHSIVGAGSVVTRSVPPWTVVQGNPATVVKARVLKR
jgi:putative colanic acid biosynthesis acetyltransferase WcaF